MLADRVRETTTTTGTGAFALAGAVQTFRPFSAAFAVGATCYYAAVNRDVAGEWEVGLGTVGAGNTLARTAVFASTNANNAVNFSAGVKDVAVTYPATKALARDANGDVGVAAGSAPRDLKVTRDLLASGAVLGPDPGSSAALRVGGAGKFSLAVTAPEIVMDRAAGTYRASYAYTSGVSRWLWGANTAAEAGANAGSDFVLLRYDDAGAFLGTALAVGRATGAVTVGDSAPAGPERLRVDGGGRFSGPVVATAYQVGAAQVVGARKTGWSLATGTATRTAFDTATVTTAQLAERVKALLDDLHASAGHGLVGA